MYDNWGGDLEEQNLVRQLGGGAPWPERHNCAPQARENFGVPSGIMKIMCHNRVPREVDIQDNQYDSWGGDLEVKVTPPSCRTDYPGYPSSLGPDYGT